MCFFMLMSKRVTNVWSNALPNRNFTSVYSFSSALGGYKRASRLKIQPAEYFSRWAYININGYMCQMLYMKVNGLQAVHTDQYYKVNIGRV